MGLSKDKSNVRQSYKMSYKFYNILQKWSSGGKQVRCLPTDHLTVTAWIYSHHDSRRATATK